MTVLPVDLRNYVDLTVYDRNPGSLVERAVNDGVAKLPGWLPAEGNTELVLIEGLALEVAELVYAINRLPAAVAEGILNLFAVARDQGAPSVLTARFTFVDDVGRSVPAGTVLRLTVAGQAWRFTTTADATAGVGDFTADAPAVCSALSASPNAAPDDAPLDLLDVHYYVESVAAVGPVTVGRDPEGPQTYIARATARLARLTDTLLLPEHFVAAAIEQPGVARAFVADLYDPGTGPAPGDNPGHTTLAVLGPDGVALSAGAKTALFDLLRPLTADHLVLHVIDATVTTVDVDVTVTRVAGYTDADVEASILATLAGYLSPDRWAWASSVYRNELIAVIDGAAGVGRVVTLTVPAADVALAGVAPLARLDDLTVTVV